MAGGSTPTGGSPSTSGTVESLLAEGRFEDAAALAHGLPDLATMADVLLTTRARTAFLDVDLALVRLLEDVLGAVDQANPSLWARLAAKLALETRGDPASADRRRALLEAATLLAHEAGDDVAMGEVLHATINALWEQGDAAPAWTQPSGPSRSPDAPMSWIANSRRASRDCKPSSSSAGSQRPNSNWRPMRASSKRWIAPISGCLSRPAGACLP